MICILRRRDCGLSMMLSMHTDDMQLCEVDPSCTKAMQVMISMEHYDDTIDFSITS